MRITIDVRMLRSSGIGVYLQNLVPRLMRLRAQDRFCLMGKPEDRKDPVWAGLSGFQWVNCHSPIYSLGQQWEFHQKTPGDTDLFWSPHYDTALWRPGRLLVTVHDLFHLAMPEFVEGFHKRLYARWMFEAVAKKAEGILVISEFTRVELARFVKVPETKVQVVPNGVDESWFTPVAGSSPHPKPFFLYVGNIKPHKNLRRLLEAFGTIKDQLPHDLLLLGQREGFLSGDEEVQRQAEAFGGRVRFTGVIPLGELQRHFAHATALVFPSLYEGFGLPPLEAMACGCPVAASTAASIPEVCGGAVLYFDPRDVEGMADRMRSLAQDQALRSELIQKGKMRAQAFSWDTCASGTNVFMDRLMAEKE